MTNLPIHYPAPRWVQSAPALTDRQVLEEMERVLDIVMHKNVFLLVNDRKRLRKIRAGIRRMKKDARQARRQARLAREQSYYARLEEIRTNPALRPLWVRHITRIQRANLAEARRRGQVFPLDSDPPGLQDAPLPIRYTEEDAERDLEEHGEISP